MPRLPNPLVYDLIETASVLAAQKGRPNLRKAAMRRAVSTAYYAAFHALCSVCAIELVGWGRTDILEPVYRMLDHGAVKRRLNGREAAALGRDVADIAIVFADLQDARHAADYASPALPVRPEETLNHIAAAERVIALVEALAPDERRRLAVLLITRARQG